jgi:hypothetical protein
MTAITIFMALFPVFVRRRRRAEGEWTGKGRRRVASDLDRARVIKPRAKPVATCNLLLCFDD